VFCARNVLVRMGVTTVYMAIITLIACLIPFFGCGRPRARARQGPTPPPAGRRPGRPRRAAARQARRRDAPALQSALQAGGQGRGATRRCCACECGWEHALPGSCSKRPGSPGTSCSMCFVLAPAVRCRLRKPHLWCFNEWPEHALPYHPLWMLRQRKVVADPSEPSAPCELVAEYWPSALC